MNSKIFSSTSGKVSPQRQRPHPASSNVAAVVVVVVVVVFVYTFSRLCSWGFPVFNFRASVNDKKYYKTPSPLTTCIQPSTSWDEYGRHGPWKGCEMLKKNVTSLASTIC